MLVPASLCALALALPAQESVPVREVLAVESLGSGGRSPVRTDALLAALARGERIAPAAGDAVVAAGGEERVWSAHEADEDGWLSGAPFRGGWAFAAVDVPEAGAWRLDASGHAFVLVDGAPRYGDPYQLGIGRVPLALEAGRHELLFRSGRGRLRAALERAPARVYLEERDRTLPDVVRGEGGTLWLGQLVANAGAGAASGLVVAASAAGGPSAVTAVPPLVPSSLRKLAVAVVVPAEAEGEELEVRLALREGATVLHEARLSLAVRDPGAKHARTFLSAIDGSVQEYAVTPPAGAAGAAGAAGVAGAEGAERPALFLSLHGAGVEARNQAYSYAPRPSGVIVAPTNRRPFGFDWEDWGRLDALEVLALAEERFGTDPLRTYLTGHSMGGHGTWQLGAHFPGRFAAIAPSAGWRDFWSYGGGWEPPAGDAVGELLARAANASRTLLLERNYLHAGVYVLHGEADESVPVSEARAMRARLGCFHPNFAYYERPGAGHWWGNECMDWPPLLAFLERNVLPEPGTVREVDFTTVDPAVSSRCRWVAIEAQERALEPSRIVARLDPETRTIEVETENVRRAALDLAPLARGAGGRAPLLPPGEPVRVVHAGQEALLPFGPAHVAVPVALAPEGILRRGRPLAAWTKGPHRSGPFKAALRHRMVLVYGTRGTAEENAWSLAKARYDHETWRYRGNGAVDVVADVDLRADEDPDRAVVLYGNRDTNAAWERVLDTQAFDLRRGAVRVGGRTLEGDDLALLAVHPRRGSDVACVAVVGGTGLPGLRTTDHLPYFVSGVGYPDWTVIGAEMLTEGLAGVRGAGFFREDWSTEEGAEAAWR